MYFSLKVRRREGNRHDPEIETKWELALKIITGGKRLAETIQAFFKPPQAKDTFFLSKRWKSLRYKVIKKNGGVCQACKTPSKAIHVDHIKPRSKFPNLEWDPDNLQVLCAECNIGKGNHDFTDWR